MTIDKKAWAARLYDAKNGVERSRSRRDQTIRAAYEAGLTKTEIAQGLGTENRARVNDALSRSKTPPEVYLQDILDAATAAEEAAVKHGTRHMSTARRMYRELGEEPLGLSTDQWDDLVRVAASALGTFASTQMQTPYPAGVVAAVARCGLTEDFEAYYWEVRQLPEGYSEADRREAAWNWRIAVRLSQSLSIMFSGLGHPWQTTQP